MKTDVEISEETVLKPISEIANQLGLDETLYDVYGKTKAKIDLCVSQRESRGKLVLVTSINPTPAGEGKTTTNIGLSMGLNRLGYPAISALREPSLGPCFGMKGGATGGGYAQVVPMDEINLHFTGDFHAITSAHNLLAAMIDNHIFHGNLLNIDQNRVVWNRVMDMNDRALRSLTINSKRIQHDTSFDITVASEIMAIVCLAEDMDDLKHRLASIVVAYDVEGEVITARDLNAVGAMTLLLKDAMKPNLVQTNENTPAIIHGGPFANIAHGCNSIIATKTALALSDYVITEAGFGADLGAEKFYDIKCRIGNLKPDVTVLVATIRALKYHGGQPLSELQYENLDALQEGIKNLVQHFDNLSKYQNNIIISINAFATDTESEIAMLMALEEELGCPVVLSNVFMEGGKGGEALAQAVVDMCEVEDDFKPLYDSNQPLSSSIETIAKEIYRAQSVSYSEEAQEQIKTIEAMNPQGLPVCIAKTQYSFSDDPKKLNTPRNFNIHVKSVRLSQGAGFAVVLLGDIMTMPGLPKHPNAENMDYTDKVIGLK